MVLDEAKIKSELAKIDYQKLNDILSKSENVQFIKFSSQIGKLAAIVLEGLSRLGPSKVSTYFNSPYICHVSPQETIDTVLAFFKEINPSYSYQIQNILQDKIVKGHSKPTCSVNFEMLDIYRFQPSKATANGQVDIVLEGNIKDVYATMHELVHKVIMPKGDLSHLAKLLAEIPAIASEFLMYDYLLPLYDNDDYTRDDIVAYTQWRIAGAIVSSLRLYMECELRNIFVQNDNYVDEESLFSYLSSFDDPALNDIVKRYFIHSTELLVKEKRLRYPVSLRYILGTLGACKFRKSIDCHKRCVEDIFKLNHLFGNEDYSILDDMKTISALGFPIFGNVSNDGTMSPDEVLADENFISIGEEVLDEFKMSYESVLDEFFGKAMDMNETIKRNGF